MLMSNPTIFLIADYGVGDPAFTEVILQLRTLIPDAFVYPHATPPFSTVNTGFWMYQIAISSKDKNTFIYSNTAPRAHDKNAQKDNDGEKLMYAKLTNGCEIMAVNAGYSFSFVKPYIIDYGEVQVENSGSQFRSRDKFPKAVAQMTHRDPSFLGELRDINTIPDAPRNVIASVDGYGNIKTSIRRSYLSYTPGQKLTITINNITHWAMYTDGMFNIPHGHEHLTFAPGSSGHEDPFMEVSIRGKNAHEVFGKPPVEAQVIHMS